MTTETFVKIDGKTNKAGASIYLLLSAEARTWLELDKQAKPELVVGLASGSHGKFIWVANKQTDKVVTTLESQQP